MNPPQNSNQNPASNPVMNQPMFNGNVGPLFPNNNMPLVTPPGFPNFPNQPFPTGQLPNGIRGPTPQQNLVPYPVNQFNLSQPQQVQLFAQNTMNHQVLMQNTIQNIYQLLQLQNSSYPQCPPGSFPVFQNPMVNVMNPQNPVNPQFYMSSPNGPVQHANNGPLQQPQNLHPTLTNFQNQIPQGAGHQNHNFFPNQMFPMQNVSQGQPGFVPPMMDVNASRQIINASQTHIPSSTPANFEDNHKNMPTSVNGGWTEGQHKNFTGHKTFDPSHKGSKSHKHMKQKFGNYKGNLEVDSVSRNSTNFEKKVPSVTYTEQEITEWREARKKNYQLFIMQKHKKEQALSDVTNQEAVLRRQQLKEILAKQAELGCEVAEVPASYLSSPEKQDPRDRKHERQQRYKKGKFHNKRRASFQDADKISKKGRLGDQDCFKPKKREPSLLQKLLTRDIKRDKTHLLQVLRFVTANSFFTGESLRFPPVIVRETNVDVSSKETCSVVKVEEEGEKETCSVMKVEEEEGEIID